MPFGLCCQFDNWFLMLYYFRQFSDVNCSLCRYTCFVHTHLVSIMWAQIHTYFQFNRLKFRTIFLPFCLFCICWYCENGHVSRQIDWKFLILCINVTNVIRSALNLNIRLSDIMFLRWWKSTKSRGKKKHIEEKESNSAIYRINRLIFK